MSCDHGLEAERLSRALEFLGRARVESYGDYHLVVVEICEDFYVFISVSCSGEGFYYEFSIGDENFVFNVDRVSCLDRAVEVVKKVAAASVPR
ncbi:MAG: hypothetical protein RMI56_03185 [Sulfolobales archaeon]|nr:hypothetical protein [Sulfolobales archaeon]MDW8082785.1 hypothetical protein [Sulfolobales archaeon]